MKISWGVVAEWLMNGTSIAQTGAVVSVSHDWLVA